MVYKFSLALFRSDSPHPHVKLPSDNTMLHEDLLEASVVVMAEFARQCTQINRLFNARI